MSTEMDRRAFLKAAAWSAAGTGLAMAMSGCGTIGGEPCPPNEDPQRIWRAGSIKIENRFLDAQAALILESGGYHLLTIEHVRRELLRHKAPTTANIPGVGTFALNISRFSILAGEFGERDSVTYYSLDQQETNIVSQAIRNKNILPLVRTGAYPASSEEVAVPNPETGANTVMKVTKRVNNVNYYEMVGTRRGTICEGRSGAPVLRICGGLTNQIYGIVSAGNIFTSERDVYTSTDKFCSSSVFFTPN